MAEGEQLNCSICLGPFTDPMLLQCFHVYCQQCLVPLVEDQDQQGQLGISCPTCHQVTPIPDRGVAGLQSAHLLESFQQLESSAAFEGATSTEADLNLIKEVSHCSVHEGRELDLYCETCEELICSRCALKGGRHHSHSYDEVSRAFETYRSEMAVSLEPLEKQVVAIKKVLSHLDVHCEEISNQCADIEGSVRVTFSRLKEVLSVRETELVGRLHQITQRKLKGLAVQKKQIEASLARLTCSLHFTRKSFRTGSEGGVLAVKKNIVRQVRELATSFQPDSLEPVAKADVVFSVSADVTVACQKYGLVFVPGLPDPSKCDVTGKGTEVAVVGEKSAAVLRAVNFEGKPCAKPIEESLGCLCVSGVMGTKVRCSVERRGQSQYEISYQPAVKGRHLLHIRVDGQHIRGSPFCVAVTSSVKKLGIPLLTVGGVDSPWGVAVNQSGEMVVTEWGGHCVSVFSPSGEKNQSFGTEGSGMGQFQHPYGVAVDGEGNILVADCGNCRIQKFDRFFMPVQTSGSVLLVKPTGIAFNASNKKVYVVDTAGGHIQVLNPDLTLCSTFGDGLFRSPYGIACGSTGKVYVTDSQDHHVLVFTEEGEHLSTLGRHGQGKGELERPFGVAVDAGGTVYVGEWGNRRVSVFNSEGHFVMSFGRRGEGSGDFEHPRGLAVDSCGVVYVCDRKNRHVQVF